MKTLLTNIAISTKDKEIREILLTIPDFGYLIVQRLSTEFDKIQGFKKILPALTDDINSRKKRTHIDIVEFDFEMEATIYSAGRNFSLCFDRDSYPDLIAAIKSFDIRYSLSRDVSRLKAYYQ